MPQDPKLPLKIEGFCQKHAESGHASVKCAIIFILLIAPALSEEFLLTPQQSLMLENRTILIEDADSQAGLVWLSVQYEKNASQSMVVAAGDAFCCGMATISVERIYAGDGTDLVALFINTTGPCRENGGKR